MSDSAHQAPAVGLGGLVLAGDGEKAFVSGADISQFEKQRGTADAHHWFNLGFLLEQERDFNRAEAALRREESRGAHYRTDFPEPVEAWRRHLVFRSTRIAEAAPGEKERWREHAG